jgi:hypothetical protein
MSLVEVLAEHVDAHRVVVALPSTQEVRLGAVEAVPWSADGPAPDGAKVVLDAWPTGWRSDRLTELLAVLGPRDLGVVLLPEAPEELPVGSLVTAVTDAGLRVVRAAAVSARPARTMVVLTADPTEPLRGHLLGTAIASDDASRLRLANEWVVESLQLRSAVGRLELRSRAALEELDSLRRERVELTSALKASEGRGRVYRGRIKELEDAQSPPGRRFVASAGRIASAIRAQPLRAPGRLVRGVAGRMRRRGA